MEDMTDAERSKKYREKHPGKAYEINKRWRHNNPKKRHDGKGRYYRKTSYSRNYHNEWTVEEMDLVLAHEMPDSELSEKLGRSVASIQNMRCKLKKQDDGVWRL